MPNIRAAVKITIIRLFITLRESVIEHETAASVGEGSITLTKTEG
jgi:hypothetical protein